MSQSSERSTSADVDVERAWTEFCDTVGAASRVVVSDTHELDALDRSEGYRYLSRLVRAGLEYADPCAPELLRLCHETIKIGADNRDNVCLSGPVHPDHRYRTHGTRGSVHYLGIGSHEGGYGSGGSLPLAGYVTLPRGTDPEAPIALELSSSPSSSAVLHLPLSARTRSVVVRQPFMDRQRETPGRLRIERTDGAHVPLPLTAAQLTRGLRAAGRFVQGCAELFASWTS